MTFHGIIDSLFVDTKDSLRLFLPELVLCGTIVLMLLVRVFTWGQQISAFYMALIGAAIALWFAIPESGLAITSDTVPRGIFTELLVYDSFTIYFRCFLLLFAVLLCVLTRITGIPDHDDGPDFYSLVFGATIGMCLMASANHLLMVFMAVEMASVPSYALAGMLKGRRVGSEAALKSPTRNRRWRTITSEEPVMLVG